MKQNNSMGTASKKAAATAASKSAERFAEKVRAAPEFAVLKGPSIVKVIFLEQPSRK